MVCQRKKVVSLLLSVMLAALAALPAAAKEYGFVRDYEPPEDTSDPIYSFEPLELTLEAAEHAVNVAIEKAEDEELDYIVARVRDVGRVSHETLKSMVLLADDFPLTLHADTTSLNWGEIDVRITFNPARATKGVNLHGSTLSAELQQKKEWFNLLYTNRLDAIYFGQRGSYGITMKIAAKVGLEGMNKSNLYFYSWRESTGTYQEISNPGYWFDDAGYLHFSTSLGDYMIISEGPLQEAE